MYQSDLFIHGTPSQLATIKKLVAQIARLIKCDTDKESALNIPLGQIMQVLTGDAMHVGLLIGMDCSDPECVVVRIECNDIVPVYEALLECFDGLEIEAVEDVEDIDWPFQ